MATITAEQMAEAYEYYHGCFFEGPWSGEDALKSAFQAWLEKGDVDADAHPIAAEMFLRDEDEYAALAEFIGSLSDDLRAVALSGIAEALNDVEDAGSLVRQLRDMAPPRNAGKLPKPADVDKAYGDGVDLYNDGNEQQAIDLVTPVLAQVNAEPGGSDAFRSGLGKLFLLRGNAFRWRDPADAVAADQDYVQATRWLPAKDMSAGEPELGRAETQLYVTKDLDRAEQLAKEGLGANPSEVRIRARFGFQYVLGAVALERKDTAAAKAAFAVIKSDFPKNFAKEAASTLKEDFPDLADDLIAALFA